MTGRAKTKEEEMSHSEFMALVRRDLREADHIIAHLEEVPQGWWGMEARYPPNREKERVTIRVDKDVMEYFRLHGRGYQAKMNEVMRAYVLARIAKVVTAPGEKSVDGDLL